MNAFKAKNKALKMDESSDYIVVFNEQLVSLSYDLIKHRLAIFKELQYGLFDLLKPFEGLNISEIDIVYLKKSFEDVDMKLYKTILSEKLEKNMFKEKAIGYSLYGPHRDDYDILINGRSVFHFIHEV